MYYAITLIAGFVIGSAVTSLAWRRSWAGETSIPHKRKWVESKRRG
jgi:hypothetical protein